MTAVHAHDFEEIEDHSNFLATLVTVGIEIESHCQFCEKAMFFYSKSYLEDAMVCLIVRKNHECNFSGDSS